MQCPKCNAPMIEQTNKKNEKGPDWKCSDSSCKWTYNFKTKEWTKGDFVTGAWNPKPKSSFAYSEKVTNEELKGLLLRILKYLGASDPLTEKTNEAIIQSEDIPF